MPSIKNMEGHLWAMTKKMVAAETSLNVLCKLRDNDIATNDIMSFALKQADLRRSNKNVDRRLLRSAMRGKICDTRVHLNRLRHARNLAKDQLRNEFADKKNKLKKITAKINGRAMELRKTSKKERNKKST